MPWNLTWLEFFKGFWPNFVSSTITGIVFGFVFSVIFTRRIFKAFDDKGRLLENLDIRIEENKKRLEYYEIFDSTFSTNELSAQYRLANLNLPNILSHKSVYSELSMWDVFVKSGELPKFLPPMTIKLIANYYDWWNNAKNLEEKLVELFNTQKDISISKNQKQIKELLEELKNTYELILRHSESSRKFFDTKIVDINTVLHPLLVEKELIEKNYPK